MSGDTSLNGIAKAINADDKAGVRATIITDGDGASYLMLSAKDTGEQASVKTITVTGSQSLQDIPELQQQPDRQAGATDRRHGCGSRNQRHYRQEQQQQHFDGDSTASH